MRLDGYPYEEHGYLTGRVKRMAPLPTSLPDGKIAYLTEITFPQASLTTHRQRLELGEQMSGTAEIITEDQRLLEKILFQFRRLRNPD